MGSFLIEKALSNSHNSRVAARIQTSGPKTLIQWFSTLTAPLKSQEYVQKKRTVDIPGTLCDVCDMGNSDFPNPEMVTCGHAASPENAGL